MKYYGITEIRLQIKIFTHLATWNNTENDIKLNLFKE